MFKSLPARLTALYTLLFAILALIVFSVIYYSLKTNLLDHVDEKFRGDGREIGEVYKQGGLTALHQEILLEEKAEGAEAMFIRIYSPDLKIVDSTTLATWGDLPARPARLNGLSAPAFETLMLPGRDSAVRIFYQPLRDGYILQMGAQLNVVEQLLTHFKQTFITVFAIILLIGAFVGHYLSRRALAGVQQVRETADKISRGDLSQQITFSAQTVEIDGLIHSINRMQSRIGTLISELQEVTDNIAHDLRSPVTRIRGLVEITLSGDSSLEEYRNMAGAVIEECDSLVRMINTMLEIAETDARTKPLALEPLEIGDMICDVVELYSSVAEDKGITLSLKSPQKPLFVSANRSRLQRAVANLLDNALKFTPTGGRVSVTLQDNGEEIEITIADSGIGIGESDLPHVWERFYRADQSRSTPGTGLGLSLVKSIINAHNATIEITSQENTGTWVTVTMDRTEL